MRRWRWVAVMAVSAVTVGCGSGSRNVDPEREKLIALDREWSKTVKDTDKFLSYYAPDASVYAPGMPIATGAANIRTVLTTMFAMPGFDLQFTPTKADASSSGDLGYTVGTYRFSANDPSGKPMTEVGKYVEVWKIQPDGQWKVVADIYNADAMPPPAPPAAAPASR